MFGFGRDGSTHSNWGGAWEGFQEANLEAQRRRSGVKGLGLSKRNPTKTNGLVGVLTKENDKPGCDSFALHDPKDESLYPQEPLGPP